MFIHFEHSSIPDGWGYRKFKLLVAIPSPRNIKSFAEAVDEHLDAYDVAWFKYFPQSSEPYRRIRSYFLSRRKYTHLAILPDDLIINEDVYKIIDLIQRMPDRYRVLMGNCNFEYGSRYTAVSKNLPSLDRTRRYYNWYAHDELKQFKKQPMKVPHAGTPFAVLRRDIVEQVSLDTDLHWNKAHGDIGTSEDVVLSNELARLKIPLYVHTGVEFLHLRGTPEALTNNIKF